MLNKYYESYNILKSIQALINYYNINIVTCCQSKINYTYKKHQILNNLMF